MMRVRICYIFQHSRVGYNSSKKRIISLWEKMLGKLPFVASQETNILYSTPVLLPGNQCAASESEQKVGKSHDIRWFALSKLARKLLLIIQMGKIAYDFPRPPLSSKQNEEQELDPFFPLRLALDRVNWVSSQMPYSQRLRFLRELRHTLIYQINVPVRMAFFRFILYYLTTPSFSRKTPPKIL